MLKLQSRRVSRCVVPIQLVLFALLAGPLPAANLTLQISSETAPPGGWAQIKVWSTTPQLVSSGRLVMQFDPAVFGPISRVAVFSPQGDAMGIASVNGNSLDVSIVSPAGGIGQLPRLPVLAVTIPVLATAPAGTVSTITLDASQARWTDDQNNAYSVTVAPGLVTVGGSLSVQDLSPGGGLLPAGTLVRIHGTGFSAATAVGIDGVSISNAQFAGPGEIDLTLGGAVELTGKRVVLRNPDGAQVVHFPAMPSVPDVTPEYFDILGTTHPLLSTQTWTSAGVTFTMRGGTIALQNPNPTAVDVILQTRDAASAQDSQTTVTIPPGALNVYRTSGGGDGFLAFAARPLRMLGLGYPFPQPGQPGFFVAAPGPTLPPYRPLNVFPAAVSFRWQAGTALPAPVGVSLYANSRFNIRATPPAAPFSVTPTQATSDSVLTVTVNPVGLSAGTYTGNVILTPEGPGAVVTTIPLSLTVSTAALLAANFESLTFRGPSNDWQSLTVASNGNSIAFTVAGSDGATPHWLSVSPSGATTPAQLTVTANSTSLGEGVYHGQVVITGPNNAVTVPVELDVSASNIYNISPGSVTFSVPAGSSPPPSQTVIVAGAVSGATLSVSTSSGGAWLSATQTPSGPSALGAVIAANPAGLKAGTYVGTVTLTSPASALPGLIPVTLAVWEIGRASCRGRV